MIDRMIFCIFHLHSLYILHFLKKNSFDHIPEFKTVPWCVNGHLHTILASLLFRPSHVDYQRKKIATPDGDMLELDLLENTSESPVAILLHGLEGSSRRYYIQNLARHLFDSGFTVAALNFRSCGGSLNSRRRFYHSGETDDLETVCEWLSDQYPQSIQLAAGFSLGGSIIFNYLNRFREESKIQGFTAISVPYDLYRGSINLQKGFNRVYDYSFVRTLRKKLELKRQQFPDLPLFNGSTLFDFDDQVTAPVHGFKDARDYYTQCSSAFFMDHIQTSGLLIHSKEDPLCPFEYTPTGAIENNPYLSTVFTDRGGHVGFWSFPAGWIELTIGHYFSHLLENSFNSSGTPSLS